MTAAFEPLIDALTAETRVFEELVRRGLAEREFLISGDVAALAENLAVQKTLIEDLAGTEKARDLALDAWRDRDPGPGGPDGPRPSLRSVIAMAPPGTAERLGALRSNLQESAEKLRSIARNNYFLALKGLEFVDQTVRIVADQVGEPRTTTYSEPGRAKAARGAAMIVDRTV